MNNKKSMGVTSPMAAATIGAIVGAGAVLLANPENRKKAKKTLRGIRKQSSDRLRQLQEKAEEVTDEGRKLISNQLEEAKEKVEKKSKRG